MPSTTDKITFQFNLEISKISVKVNNNGYRSEMDARYKLLELIMATGIQPDVDKVFITMWVPKKGEL